MAINPEKASEANLYIAHRMHLHLHYSEQIGAITRSCNRALSSLAPENNLSITNEIASRDGHKACRFEVITQLTLTMRR